MTFNFKDKVKNVMALASSYILDTGAKKFMHFYSPSTLKSAWIGWHHT
jgi:hypothetical protein